MTNKKLPESLDQLGEPVTPTAPEDRPAYRYSVTTEGFELCATFNQESTDAEMMYGSAAMPTDTKMMIQNPDNWQHGTGEACFKRVVTKDLPK
jgi:hypothetical protein